MGKRISHNDSVAPYEQAIADAISAAKEVIASGGKKIDAAMVIFEKLETQSQDTVCAAFVEGASLTTKGAITYWYTCRRKLAKRRSDEKLQ